MTTKNMRILITIIVFTIGTIFGTIVGTVVSNIANSNKELYIVYFNTDGGNKVERQILSKGEQLELPKAPQKENYTFEEWQLDGNKYDFSKKITQDITLVAKWKETFSDLESTPEEPNEEKPEEIPEKVTYTVTFNTNGGSKVSNQTIEEGKKAKKPTNPTRNGYTFTGWTLNGKTYNFNTAVTKEITLTATWKKVTNESTPSTPKPTEKKYTITFDSNGGTAVSSQTIIEGKTAAKPQNPTKSGYTFSGWTLDGAAYNFNNAITKDITLIASWTKIKIEKNYTIKATAVDSQSPARVLSVYENGTKINVQAIKYSDGTLLCSGSNMNVNVYALDDTSYKVVLTDGTEVKATLVS